jgi:ATP-binding cassette, subfamily C (CFTR/MRP), member 1
MDKDGGIEDEGNFEEVNARAGNTFDMALDVDNTRKNDPKKVLIRERDPTLSSRAPAINAEADLSRQTGDSAVYKYYAKSAKLINSLIFISSMVVFAFCDAFPSK